VATIGCGRCPAANNTEIVAIVKKRLNLDASLHTLLQILSVTIFEKIRIYQALVQGDTKCATSQLTNQLSLFVY
jgi:hypothetical protein